MFPALLDTAAELAAEWHDGTYRKGRWRTPVFEREDGGLVQTPMMAHLTAVALLVMRAGFDDETAAAALLHDSIEDANRDGVRLRVETLREAVGDRVTDLVLDVSEPKLRPDGSKVPWLEAKEAYVAHLYDAPVEAAAISLADKWHNLWSMNETLAAGYDVFRSDAGRIGLSAGPSQQRWYFDAVLEATAHHDDERLDGFRANLRGELARFERLVGLDRED